MYNFSKHFFEIGPNDIFICCSRINLFTFSKYVELYHKQKLSSFKVCIQYRSVLSVSQRNSNQTRLISRRGKLGLVGQLEVVNFKSTYHQSTLKLSFRTLLLQFI